MIHYCLEKLLLKFYRLHKKNFIYQTKYNFKIYILPEKLYDIIRWDQSCDAEPLLDYLQEKKISGDVFIDIGANIGIVSIYASSIFKNVYSFEPEQTNHGYLKENINLNNIKNIKVFNMCVSDISGHVTLNVRDQFAHHGITSSHASTIKSRVEVVSVTLDEFLLEHDISKVDVLKVDVEGAEWLVLKGAQNSLVSGKIELIIFEYQPSQITVEHITYIFEKLAELEYQVSDSEGKILSLASVKQMKYGDYFARRLIK